MKLIPNLVKPVWKILHWIENRWSSYICYLVRHFHGRTWKTKTLIAKASTFYSIKFSIAKRSAYPFFETWMRQNLINYWPSLSWPIFSLCVELLVKFLCVFVVIHCQKYDWAVSNIINVNGRVLCTPPRWVGVELSECQIGREKSIQRSVGKVGVGGFKLCPENANWLNELKIYLFLKIT